MCRALGGGAGGMVGRRPYQRVPEADGRAFDHQQVAEFGRFKPVRIEAKQRCGTPDRAEVTGTFGSGKQEQQLILRRAPPDAVGKQPLQPAGKRQRIRQWITPGELAPAQRAGCLPGCPRSTKTPPTPARALSSSRSITASSGSRPWSMAPILPAWHDQALERRLAI